MDITVTQISLLSFSLLSLPHKVMVTVSVQAFPSADLGGDMLAGTKEGWGVHFLWGMCPVWWWGIWADIVGFIQWRQFTEPVGDTGELQDLPRLWKTHGSAL